MALADTLDDVGYEEDEQQRRRALLAAPPPITQPEVGVPIAPGPSISSRYELHPPVRPPAQPYEINLPGDVTPGIGRARGEIASRPPDTGAPAIPEAPPITAPSQPTRPTPAANAYESLRAKGPAWQREGKGARLLDILGMATGVGRNIERASGLGSLGYQSQLGAARTAAEEEQKPPFEQARTEEQQARAEQERAKAEALKHPPAKPVIPKEEVWKVVPGVVGPGGKVLQEEQNSGQVRWAPGIEGITPLKEAVAKDMTAKPGTVNGRPVWAIQTEQGWIDPETREIIHGFSPQPTFAETGLYEQTSAFDPKTGQMVPARFDRRSGRIIGYGGETHLVPIGPEATKMIGTNLEGAREADTRLETMTQNYDDGLKGDQQAMLSLLANHIGMTLGLQKGARITQAIYDEAMASAPIIGRIASHFDKRGYLTGVTLTPEQMKQMMDLAEQKRGYLWTQAEQAGKTYGIPLQTQGLRKKITTKSAAAPEQKAEKGKIDFTPLP